MSDQQENPTGIHDADFQLIWSPPSYDYFKPEDQVKFKLLLDKRGWVIAVVWVAFERPEGARCAGVLWNTQTNLVRKIWEFMGACASTNTDALDCYESVVLSSTSWTEEFEGQGDKLELACRWVHYGSDATWTTTRAPLPPRAHQWGWADPDDFTFYATNWLEHDEGVLIAVGLDKVLLRDDAKWWVMPEEELSAIEARLVALPADFARRYRELGNSVLDEPLGNWQAIPDNGEWLLIDTNDGWTFQAGATLLVQALDGTVGDRLQEPDAASERMEYVEQLGVSLLFPQAPGTPLHVLEGDWWLISLDNGDWTENVADVVLVSAPQDLMLDNSQTGLDDALRCARRSSGVPSVQRVEALDSSSGQQ